MCLCKVVLSLVDRSVLLASSYGRRNKYFFDPFSCILFVPLTLYVSEMYLMNMARRSMPSTIKYPPKTKFP